MTNDGQDGCEHGGTRAVRLIASGRVTEGDDYVRTRHVEIEVRREACAFDATVTEVAGGGDAVHCADLESLFYAVQGEG